MPSGRPHTNSRFRSAYNSRSVIPRSAIACAIEIPSWAWKYGTMASSLVNRVGLEVIRPSHPFSIAGRPDHAVERTDHGGAQIRWIEYYGVGAGTENRPHHRRQITHLDLQ